MAKTIFEFLTDLHTKTVSWKDLSETDKKQFGVFMVNRWLSMKTDYLDLVAQTQQYTMYMDPGLVFEMYRDFLPKQQKFFVKYISSKTEKEKALVNLIQFIAKKWHISEKEADEYLDIIQNTGKMNQLIEWLKKFGYDEKELSRIYKVALEKEE